MGTDYNFLLVNIDSFIYGVHAEMLMENIHHKGKQGCSYEFQYFVDI
jgi:hypothetical protein